MRAIPRTRPPGQGWPHCRSYGSGRRSRAWSRLSELAQLNVAGELAHGLPARAPPLARPVTSPAARPPVIASLQPSREPRPNRGGTSSHARSSVKTSAGSGRRVASSAWAPGRKQPLGRTRAAPVRARTRPARGRCLHHIRRWIPSMVGPCRSFVAVRVWAVMADPTRGSTPTIASPLLQRSGTALPRLSTTSTG